MVRREQERRLSIGSVDRTNLAGRVEDELNEHGRRRELGDTRLALVSRGDPLTPFLHRALSERYPVVAEINVELKGSRRAAVAAATWRPTWKSWSETYITSNFGFRMRSSLAQQRLSALPTPFDAIVQTHALFASHPSRSLIYVDCTYRQAMASWSAWTPQRGNARDTWLRHESQAYRRTLHLFAVTDAVRDSLVNDYGIDPSRVTVVGVGASFVTLPPVRPSARKTGATVLFVGKDFNRKGGPSLLRAFAQVRRRIPQARLQIVGTNLAGPVPSGVEVLGLVKDRARLAQLYAAADVFCLPSLFDPGPLVVLEAMGHGLPCVLSVAGSRHVKDIVDDGIGGRAVAAGDEVSLAEALVELLDAPDVAHKMGVAGRQYVTEQHMWSQVVDRMAPALDAVVPIGSAAV